MASPQLLTVQDFAESRYESLGDQATDLSSLIRRAEDIIGDKIGMPLAKATYTDEGVVKSGVNQIFVSRRPVVVVTSLDRRLYERGDWSAIPSDSYSVNSVQGILTLVSDVSIYGYVETPYQGYYYRVIYEAGYTPLTLPEALKEAVLLQTVLLLFRDYEIFGAGDSKEPGINHIRKEIEEYIAPHKRSRMVLQ